MRRGPLRHLGPDLCVQRSFNVPLTDKSAILDVFDKVLTEGALAKSRKEAQLRHPVILHEESDWQLVVVGPGLREPRNMPHGDTANSLPVFLREIVKAKKDENGLSRHHPNLLMANGLGVDFQRSLDEADRVGLSTVYFANLDSMLVAACGIDSSLNTCKRAMFLSSQEGHPAQTYFSWASC